MTEDDVDSLTVPASIVEEGPPGAVPPIAPAGPRGHRQEDLLEGSVRNLAQDWDASPARLDRFLREPDWSRAIAEWLGLSDQSVSLPERSEVARRLGRDAARIDDLIAQQVNAILHHPAFQKLEASWRGL